MLARIRRFLAGIVILAATWGVLAMIGAIAGVLPAFDFGGRRAADPAVLPRSQADAGVAPSGRLRVPSDAGAAVQTSAGGSATDRGAPRAEPPPKPDSGVRDVSQVPRPTPSPTRDPTTGSAPPPPPQGLADTATACGPTGALDDLRASHTAAALRETLVEIARRRYPQAERFIDAQPDVALTTWVQQPASFDAVLEAFPTVAHEGSHLWIARHRRGRGYVYPVDAERTLRTRFARTFTRDHLMPHHVAAASDTYASTYLTGTTGAQGFDTLLDEFNAYTHTLAAYHCLRDALRPGRRRSARDGLATLRYWTALYLKLAREETIDATTYRRIVRDRQLREAVVGIYDRSEAWLHVATASHLGIRDAEIRRWLTPELRQEYERLREE